MNYGIEDDSLIFQLKDYFETQEDYRYAGEANYIIGRNLVLQRNSPLATFYLKTAEENLLKSSDVPSRLLGATYYGLGNCAEGDRLFEIANDFYKQALPYFKFSQDSLYVSSIYRDLAKTDTINSCFGLSNIDSALHYLPSACSPSYRLTIEITKYCKILQIDTSLVNYNYHLLCDSLLLYTYAEELYDHYLSIHQLDSAYYYLTLSALDTANSYWSKEHYLFNKAGYLAEVGQKDSAIAVLKDLHLEQTAEIENSAFARSYMVEQRYDAERERMAKEKAQDEKRHAHAYIILICVAALFLTATLLLLLQRERQRQKQKEEHNRFLEEQLHIKQDVLQQQLRQRIDVSTALRRHSIQGKKYNETTYNKLIADIVFLKPEQWSGFLTSFNAAYYGVLNHILCASPSLTELDQLYIAMIVLGCTTEDISILTNVSNQSVWNRKQLLRRRLEVDKMLEDWLQDEISHCKAKMFR